MLKKTIHSITSVLIILILIYLAQWLLGSLFYKLTQKFSYLSYISSVIFCFFWIGLFLTIKIKHSLLQNFFLAIIGVNGFLMAYTISIPFCYETYNQLNYTFPSIILLFIAFYLVIQYILPKFMVTSKIIVGCACVLYTIDHVFFLIVDSTIHQLI